MILRCIFFSIFISAVICDLVRYLASPPHKEETSPVLIEPISYDIQVQLPLSEASDPEVPLFTAHVVFQFDLTKDIGSPTPIVREDQARGASFKLLIDGLDHFENVSLVFNATEVPIENVVLTDQDMEITVSQAILFNGRYTLSVSRYKGLVGHAIYYRDAGEHAVFGSSFFRAPAVFPTIGTHTQAATFAMSIIHPIGTMALSSGPMETIQPIDEHWQMTSFHTTKAIVPSMLSLALLPSEYTKVENTYTGIHITVHFNRYKVQMTQAKQMLTTATQVFGILKQMFSSSIPMSKLDLVLLNDVAISPAFGTVIIPEGTYLASDYENQIFTLATVITKHWIGGLLTVSKEEDICLQEDMIVYMAFKVIKRMTNDDHIRLSHYIKISLTESLFEPGMSLILSEPIDEYKVSYRCGLKGVTMLESLEYILGEKFMISMINQLIFHSPRGKLDMESIITTMNRTVDDNVRTSLVYGFWRDHGGIPNLHVDRFNNSMKVKQVLDNSTVEKGSSTWERMQLWPLPLQFTEFKLPINLMLSQGIHLAPVRDGLSLANLGFNHYYRVNYDVDTWRQILDKLMTNATVYTIRERAQLTTDFCYFYSQGVLAEPVATELRDQWLQMLRLRAPNFPMCEATAFRCLAVRRLQPLTDTKTMSLRKQLFDAMTSSGEMTCGRGAVHDAVNHLCTDLYGRSCF